jgi:hypothetical protein
MRRPIETIQADDFEKTTATLKTVCGLAGASSLVKDIEGELAAAGIRQAIASRDTAVIFDWMARTVSYQGISDAVAREYLRKHGSIRFQDIETALRATPKCGRLRSYWSFDGCLYDKGSHSCAEPELIGGCPLPTHNLRNGKLNQSAYSLYLFVRDVANGDLVTWIDDQLEQTRAASLGAFQTAAHEALVGPLRHVFGLSDKILTMTLSGLLMADREARPHWFDAGAGLIAIDTLVHNFLHRTGILARHCAEHAYGPRCYAQGGCAAIIRQASAAIDASRFNPTYPPDFPRFVQHAVWRYCAGDGLNICNGNMIDDAKPCQNLACQLARKCDKIPLKSAKMPIESYT